MSFDFKSDPSVGPLDDFGGKVPNQLDLAKKPQRFRFQIVCDGFSPQEINTAIGRAMTGPDKNTVDHVDLNINPSQYRVSEPTREGITQTVAGAWVDYYGLGLPKITMSGTTGWRPNPVSTKKSLGALFRNIGLATRGISTAIPNPPTGLADFIYLRNRIFRTYAVLLQRLNVNFSNRVQSQLQLRFYAWDTQDYYIVLIDNFELLRNAARPLLYDYNISMTVIGYVGDRQVGADYLAAYWKSGGLTRLQAITQTFKRWVANAKNFQNSVTAFNQEISNEIGAITNSITLLSTAIDDVVSGVSAFVTFPLAATQEVVTAARALGDLLVTVENIPARLRDDIHNSLVETICACYGLVTYKSLFNQPFGDAFSDAPWKNLTCSSTLGIPPNPTTPEIGVTAPSQDPSAINSGVYDPNTLQTVPVAMTGTARKIAPFRVREVVINEGQTVESLVRSIGGLDASVAQVWQQIVTLNNLEYPYIAPNVAFKTNFNATVSINIYGTPGTTVDAGTRVGTQQVSTPEDVIAFSVINSVTISASGVVVAQATAIKAGAFANVKPFTIVNIIDLSGAIITISGVTRIENSAEAVGGKILRVLSPGQKIKIPVAQSQAIAETVVERTDVVEQDLFGNDIFLTQDGDFVSDGGGDLAVVRGIENMKVALIDRLTTEQGELTKHPRYGAPIARMIGEPGDQHVLTVAKLELKSTVLQDPRIKGVSNITLKKSGDVLDVDMNLHLIDETTRATSAELPLAG